MPRYSKGKGKLQRKKKWKSFEGGVLHMSQWLSKTPQNDPIWKKHFQEAAKHFEQGGKQKTPYFAPRSLVAVQTKRPVQLAGDVLSELKGYKRGKQVGGGVTELLHWLSSETAQVTGFNTFKEFIGQGYEHRKIPNEAQIFAKAVDATYFDVNKRPSELEGMLRLKEYDDPRFSVWREPNGQLLVSIHGTKANWSDIKEDLSIAGGGKVQSAEVQALFDRLDREGETYDVASHSLASAYVANSTHENADRIYMYNIASSPLMTSEYLQELGNNKDWTYFINPSDGVSEAAWQKMNDETVKRSYIAPYNYSQVRAHSISQWYPDLDAPNETEEQLTEKERHNEILRNSSAKFREAVGLDK